jgi:malate dehydrogenase (oxaloacetate-decarboxylating)(NADP+)
MTNLKEKALAYHNMNGVPGKIGIALTKPCKTAEDLALAYTPGVAQPVLEIEKNNEDAYKYTAKGNLVGVIRTVQQYLDLVIEVLLLANQ